MTKYKILVVDDEESLCEILQFNLEVEGYEVDVAYSAEQALDMHPERYSLILLDVMMGETSGFKMARQLKSRPETAGVRSFSARPGTPRTTRWQDSTSGPTTTSPSPFPSARCSHAYAACCAARHSRPQKRRPWRSKGCGWISRARSARSTGEPLALTKKEFEILALLLSSRGKIFSREEILRQVWSDEVIVLDRTIDVNITRLRRKIGPYGEHIVTRLGYGYGFEE